MGEAAGVTLWDAKEGGNKGDPGFIPFRAPLEVGENETVHVTNIPGE